MEVSSARESHVDVSPYSAVTLLCDPGGTPTRARDKHENEAARAARTEREAPEGSVEMEINMAAPSMRKSLRYRYKIAGIHGYYYKLDVGRRVVK